MTEFYFETSESDGTCRVNLTPGSYPPKLCGREACAKADFQMLESDERVHIPVCREHGKKIAASGTTVRFEE
jgi:hypothetical protein